MSRYLVVRHGLSLAAALVLAACASTGPAPVEDRSLGAPRTPPPPPPRADARPASQPTGGSYKVQRGDTLYSIAFRHGVDYRDLAGWNGIAAPYTIYVGQELRLASKALAANARPTAAPPAPPRPASSTSAAIAVPPAPAKPAAPAPTAFEDVKEQPIAATPSAASATPPASPSPSPTAMPPVVAGPSTKPVDATPAPTTLVAPPPQSANVSGEIAWRWPADGQVIGSFVGGDQTKQGIDIGGKAGDPVRAAADGTVVYSGNGLIGYGELIIVKHSPGFLSAYGHNRKRLVKEGDHVKSGQVIAEMGSSSASRDSLHFEIRKNGKPANPVDYLPRR